jgi:hypothetical protein
MASGSIVLAQDSGDNPFSVEGILPRNADDNTPLTPQQQAVADESIAAAEKAVSEQYPDLVGDK